MMDGAGRGIQQIERDGDVVLARQMARQLAEEIGFSRAEQALIATAVSELARNIVNYAGSGMIAVTKNLRGRNIGLTITATDDGPGIADLDAAMVDGFSTGNSLGLGLPGTRRIMDEFEISSPPGNGLTVIATKWAFE
ncbi:MAG: anti-sigma regulatory factor [Paracoccaceae bacterium]